jgi:hypothetical protein
MFLGAATVRISSASNPMNASSNAQSHLQFLSGRKTLLPKRSHLVDRLAPYPLWMRVSALVCMLLVFVLSSLQATHIHDAGLSVHGTQVTVQSDNQPSSEANCPLCVAMHSALGIERWRSATTLTDIECELVSSTDHVVSSFQFFSLSIRPPPTA